MSTACVQNLAKLKVLEYIFSSKVFLRRLPTKKKTVIAADASYLLQDMGNGGDKTRIVRFEGEIKAGRMFVQLFQIKIFQPHQ